MIIKCQVLVSSLLLNIPKVKSTESNGSTNKMQSKDLCGGERFLSSGRSSVGKALE